MRADRKERVYRDRDARTLRRTGGRAGTAACSRRAAEDYRLDRRPFHHDVERDQDKANPEDSFLASVHTKVTPLLLLLFDPLEDELFCELVDAVVWALFVRAATSLCCDPLTPTMMMTTPRARTSIPSGFTVNGVAGCRSGDPGRPRIRCSPSPAAARKPTTFQPLPYPVLRHALARA